MWHRHGADLVLAHELGEDEEVFHVDRGRTFPSPGEQRHERHGRHDEVMDEGYPHGWKLTVVASNRVPIMPHLMRGEDFCRCGPTSTIPACD